MNLFDKRLIKPGDYWLTDATGRIVGASPADLSATPVIFSNAAAPIQNAIPMILPSSGTIGNNGALSALTALPTTYTSAYLYFPAGAIAAGSLAGLYYCVMSSTTAGTIYNNTYDPSLGVMPTIPANPTPFVTTGPGAYTQTTGADISMVGVTIPGNSMGNSGSILVVPMWSFPNNVNNKFMRGYYSTALFAGGLATTTISWAQYQQIFNRAASNKQVSLQGNGISAPTLTAVTYWSIDSTADQLLKETAQLAVATDYLILESCIVTIRYGA